MNKINVVLFYWIAIAAALMFAKVAGLTNNDSAIIKIIIVVTILYIGITLHTFSRFKKIVHKDIAGQTKKSTKKNIKK